jgi:hypothetical protein
MYPSILSFETINKLKLSFECGIPQELGPGRVELPEDVGKGGDLWHGRAGADDKLLLS